MAARRAYEDELIQLIRGRYPHVVHVVSRRSGTSIAHIHAQAKAHTWKDAKYSYFVDIKGVQYVTPERDDPEEEHTDASLREVVDTVRDVLCDAAATPIGAHTYGVQISVDEKSLWLHLIQLHLKEEMLPYLSNKKYRIDYERGCLIILCR